MLSKETKSYSQVKQQQGMIVTEEKTFGNIWSYIMYDPDTYVMYVLVMDPASDATGFSVMYNQDGSVKLYEPEKGN